MTTDDHVTADVTMAIECHRPPHATLTTLHIMCFRLRQRRNSRCLVDEQALAQLNATMLPGR